MGSLSKCVSAVACYGFTVDCVVQHYLEWVAKPFYFVIHGHNSYLHETEYRAVKGVKRGDERYGRKVLRKWDKLERAMAEKIGTEQFFRWGEHDRKKIRSPLVFASLTYSSSIPLEESWKRVGKDLNRWICGLRRKTKTRNLGKISIVRCFESQTRGYVHVHVLLYFHDMTWQGFPWFDKKRNRWTYRVDRVGVFKQGWRGGFTDILLMNSCKSAYDYQAKYITKSVEKVEKQEKETEKERIARDKAEKTLALSWFFHKRAFSISGEVWPTTSDLNNSNNTNSNRISGFHAHFKQFGGGDLYVEPTEWFLYGLLPSPPDYLTEYFQKISADQVNELEEQGLVYQRDGKT